MSTTTETETKEVVAKKSPSAKVDPIKKQMERDLQPVTGIFRFIECPGATLSFCKKKYPGEKLSFYSWKDGEKVTCPRYVAQDIANETYYPVHEYCIDHNGRQHQLVGNKIRRMDFQSLEFFPEPQQLD